jgi:homocysteine S-methyltransferase
VGDDASVPLDLGDRIRVLDGGLGSTLAEQGFDLTDRLWSARVLLEHPAAVQAVHEAFFAAGADVAVTASYQVSREGFALDGLPERSASGALAASVDVARAAARQAGPHALVAASVGPYGATLADGSEYRGDYDLGPAELVQFHRWRLQVLERAGPDLLAIETLPTQLEAEAVLEALADDGPPVWVSFTCVDGARTAGGDEAAAAARVAAGHPRVAAVGVNCTAATHVGPALAAIGAAGTGLPLVVYPNAGGTWDADARAWSGADDQALAPATVDGWVAAGARLVGGCCGTSPHDIAALRAHLDSRSGDI